VIKLGKHNIAESGWPSLVSNSLILSNYYDRLKSLAINGIEWINLPPEIDERFLELTLFEYGMGLFFRDEIAEKYVALTTSIGGPFTIYNIPQYRHAYSVNGYNYFADNSNSVIIFNNYLRRPEIEQTRIFAQRLYEIERAIDVNIKGQKFPLAVIGPENKRLSLLNLYKQYDGNEPFIFGNDESLLDAIKVVRTESPYVADRLQALKQKVWTEALSYYGIDNVQEKTERMVSLESVSSLGYIEAQRLVRLNARKQACKQINEMFGLNIDVQYRYQFNLEKAMEFKERMNEKEFDLGGDTY